jgi:preprotein translocase subunit YajC
LNLNEWATLTVATIGLVIGFATLLSSNKWRNEKNFAARIQELEHIDQVLTRIGIKGSDTKVEVEQRTSAHEALVAKNHKALRANVGMYLDAVTRPGPTLLGAGLAVGYGVFLIAYFAIQIAARYGSPQLTLPFLFGSLFFVAVGIAVCLVGTLRWRSAKRTARVRKTAGVDLITWREEFAKSRFELKASKKSAGATKKPHQEKSHDN